MTLKEAVAKMNELAQAKYQLQDELKKTEESMGKCGSAIFAAVRHLAQKGKPTVEFQVGSEQYEIKSTGELKRINEVSKADESMKIELGE